MRSESEHFRDRVMDVRMLAIYSLPIGLLAAGNLIGEIGVVATASLYAATGLLLMLFITLHWRADLWHIHAPAIARQPPHHIRHPISTTALAVSSHPGDFLLAPG